jgi:hypothetical protein
LITFKTRYFLLLQTVPLLQADFVVAFLGVTFSRAVAAPLNAAYKEVNGSAQLAEFMHQELLHVTQLLFVLG